jgi:hypothetical protein
MTKCLSVGLAIGRCTLAFMPGLVEATTLTAVCGEPQGYSFGVSRGKMEQGADKITGSTSTYSWEVRATQAKVILQDTASVGGTPRTHDAVVIPRSQNHISFVVPISDGIDVHSLFINEGIVFMSAHKEFAGRGLITGRTLYARCRISYS